MHETFNLEFHLVPSHVFQVKHPLETPTASGVRRGLAPYAAIWVKNSCAAAWRSRV
jgi:hypothetical protein